MKSGAQVEPLSGGLVIGPAGAGLASALAYAELKNMATGNTLRPTLGRNHEAILCRLYEHPDTLQSHSRVYIAGQNGEAVGLLSCISFAEYRTRLRVSSRLIRRASLAAGLRVALDAVRRWIMDARLGPWAPGQLYIESLAVREGARRQGVATALLAHAAASARAQRCDNLSLHTLTTNDAALSLYLANGFVIHARRGRHLRLVKDLHEGIACRDRVE